MLEILQFYVSSFWIWLGITVGVYIIATAIASIVAAAMNINK